MKCQENTAVDPFFNPAALDICQAALDYGSKKLSCGPESVFLESKGIKDYKCSDVPKFEFADKYHAPKDKKHPDDVAQAKITGNIDKYIPSGKTIPHNECEQDLKKGCTCFCTVKRTVKGLVARMNEHLSSVSKRIKTTLSSGDDHRFSVVSPGMKKRNGHVKEIDPEQSRKMLSYSLCMMAGGMIVPFGVSYWNTQRNGIPDHWIFAYGYNLVSAPGGHTVEIYAHDVGRWMVNSDKTGLTAEQYIDAVSSNQHVTLYVDSNGGRIFKPGPHDVRPMTAGGYDVVEIALPYLPYAEPNT